MQALSLSFKALCLSEQKWIQKTVFEHFLGLKINNTQVTEASDLLQLSAAGKTLSLSQVFFQAIQAKWLDSDTLPQTPSQLLPATELSVLGYRGPDLPVLFGQATVTITPESLVFGFDMLGTCFFLLSRYEEAVLSQRDQHQRFPAEASWMGKAGMLERPLVDEYVEVLSLALQYLWPDWKPRPRTYSKMISCDVDYPYAYEASGLYPAMREMGRSLIRQKQVKAVWSKARNALASARGHYQHDPYHTFDWMMTVNEAAGNQMTFYFIVARRCQQDGYYSIDEPRIRKLIHRIAERGHRIGLHVSYLAYNRPDDIQQEKNILSQVLEAEKIEMPELGSRQHYLRWQSSVTANYLEAAGLHYDTSLSFADQAGFRCGTCHAFPMYSLEQRRSLNLWQRPLILMECSVIAERYLNLGYSEQALEKMLAYKAICQHYQGNFSLLWHNSHFLHADDARFYLQLIA